MLHLEWLTEKFMPSAGATFRRPFVQVGISSPQKQKTASTAETVFLLFITLGGMGFVLYCYVLEISLEETFETAAMSCFVTKTLENAVKTGIFNRLAQK